MCALCIQARYVLKKDIVQDVTMKYQDYIAAFMLLSISTALKIGTIIALCSIHGQCNELSRDMAHKDTIKKNTVKISKKV